MLDSTDLIATSPGLSDTPSSPGLPNLSPFRDNFDWDDDF